MSWGGSDVFVRQPGEGAVQTSALLCLVVIEMKVTGVKRNTCAKPALLIVWLAPVTPGWLAFTLHARKGGSWFHWSITNNEASQ